MNYLFSIVLIGFVFLMGCTTYSTEPAFIGERTVEIPRAIFEGGEACRIACENEANYPCKSVRDICIEAGEFGIGEDPVIGLIDRCEYFLKNNRTALEQHRCTYVQGLGQLSVGGPNPSETVPCIFTCK